MMQWGPEFLRVQLNLRDERVLVVGESPVVEPVLMLLQQLHARVTQLNSADQQHDQYARRHLTPRPMLIVLLTEDEPLIAQVQSDARERGILVITGVDEEPPPGGASFG